MILTISHVNICLGLFTINCRRNEKHPLYSHCSGEIQFRKRCDLLTPRNTLQLSTLLASRVLLLVVLYSMVVQKSHLAIFGSNRLSLHQRNTCGFKKKRDVMLLSAAEEAWNWGGGILTAGPLGPLSPFSHAHWLRARGHLKDKEVTVGIRVAFHRDKSKDVWKSCRAETYPFICQLSLWSKKQMRKSRWCKINNLLKVLHDEGLADLKLPYIIAQLFFTKR